MCAVVGWIAFGLGGAISAVIIGITVRRRRAAQRGARETLAGIESFAEAVRALVAELATGAHPATAAERVSADADALPAKALRAAATALRLNTDVEAALADADLPPTLAPAARRVARAWALAARHGLPLTDVLHAVRLDLDHRARFARQVSARMAGPRSSATALASLPVVGVLLGQAAGADPLHVFTTPLGHVFLVLGTGLVAAGLAWTSRLTNQAVFH
ncbi:type II secretion system F family protein [Actinokineospora bangkokensis]|uniref:type II secretion system F family protein n=1 Tax=Actinokineospora bangkokensis TaxID=1193682 RepID=UPI0013016D59|nr:type II secretion system F family protein [Actinokineospora bangkokensis]